MSLVHTYRIIAGHMSLGDGHVPGGSITFSATTAGFENIWTVPAGVTSLSKIDMYAAGGGGGGVIGNGDHYAGGGGGSGGFLEDASMSVTPGETLIIIVGVGGRPGAVNIENRQEFVGSQTTGTKNGAAGGATLIRRGASTILTVTGGGGGIGDAGDDKNIGTSGAGGIPGGVAGGPQNNLRRHYPPVPGGNNGTGYGTGGNSQAYADPTLVSAPTAGGDGIIEISWGTA